VRLFFRNTILIATLENIEINILYNREYSRLSKQEYKKRDIGRLCLRFDFAYPFYNLLALSVSYSLCLYCTDSFISLSDIF